MEGIQNIGLFVGLAWLLIISPGPDTIFVLTKSISNGKKSGIISALGVTLGIFVHTLFAAFGLSIILQTSALAFSLVKFMGAAYLIYLGIQAIRNNQKLKFSENSIPAKKIFYHAFLTNVLNPKVALFFIAFLPQFVVPETTNSWQSLITLGIMFAFFTMLFLSVLAMISANAGKWIMKNTFLATYLQRIAGLIFIGLGIRLALIKNI